LVLRHASELTTALAVLQPGQIYVESSLAHGVLFDDGVIPGGFGPDGETRDLVVDAYYVDNASTFSDSIPSLRRKTLVKGGQIEDQEMITGVENLQVQYGLDTNGDGTVERYVDPDSPTVTEGSPGFLPDAKIVAVRIWILVRAEESPDPGFSDGRVYQPLDLNAALITPGSALYPPQFPRIEVTKTIFLRNQVIG
jgi:type IV pilus assembly protein PilW